MAGPERIAIRPIEARDELAVAAVIRDVMTEFGACGPGYSIGDAEVSAMHAAYSGPRSAYFVVELGGRVEGGGGYAPLAGGDGATCELRKMYFRPALRGLGAGAAVLSRCLDGARRAGFARCYLETLASMAAARKLYERSGFRPLARAEGATGHYGCDAWYALPLAGHVAVRPEAGADREAVRALVTAAFGRADEAQLARRLAESDPSALALVAVDGAEVVGHVVVSAAALADGAARAPARILGPLAVRPDAQRRGVGAALVRAAVEGSRAHGGVCVVLGDPRYYARFGFVRADARGLAGLPEWPAEAFQALELEPGAFAAARGRVALPPAWGAT